MVDLAIPPHAASALIVNPALSHAALFADGERYLNAARGLADTFTLVKLDETSDGRDVTHVAAAIQLLLEHAEALLFTAYRQAKRAEVHHG